MASAAPGGAVPASRGRAGDAERNDAMLKDFRAFLLRGNVVDLAVAVIVGAAFTALVTALVKDLFTPLIAAVFGKHDFSALTFAVNGSTFRYGDFLNALIAFLSITTVVFFLVVKPINALMARRRTRPDPDSETRSCPECLSDVPKPATRCAFCTSALAPATPA